MIDTTYLPFRGFVLLLYVPFPPYVTFAGLFPCVWKGPLVGYITVAAVAVKRKPKQIISGNGARPRFDILRELSLSSLISILGVLVFVYRPPECPRMQREGAQIFICQTAARSYLIHVPHGEQRHAK